MEAKGMGRRCEFLRLQSDNCSEWKPRIFESRYRMIVHGKRRCLQYKYIKLNYLEQINSPCSTLWASSWAANFCVSIMFCGPIWSFGYILCVPVIGGCAVIIDSSLENQKFPFVSTDRTLIFCHSNPSRKINLNSGAGSTLGIFILLKCLGLARQFCSFKKIHKEE